MSLGHGSNNQIKGAPKLKTKDPWRTVPQGAGEGISSDGNTISLAPIDDGQVLANTSGANDIPVGTSLSDLLDHDLTDQQGSIIFRSSASWSFLLPSTSGYLLETRGAGFDPQWIAGSGLKALPIGPPVAPGDGNLDLALTDGAFPNPTILLDGSGNPIYVAVPFDYGLSTTLTDSHVFVGNSSNVATDVVISGDATLADTGALTLASTGVTATTYGDATHVPQITFDAKGRATAASNVSITQPLAANPTAQVAGSAVNGTAITFMRSDAAPKLADTAVTPGSYGDATHVGTFTVDQQGRLTTAGSTSITQPVGANPTATASDTAVNGTAITFMRSDGAPAIQKGLSSQFGVVKVDGTTVTSTAGVLSATSGITGFANPTASVGLSTVNGSAVTAMRSDAAPALSQSISPTWSGNHIFSNPVKFADGSASSPSVLFDTNTGLFNDTVDLSGHGLGISIGGTQIGSWGLGQTGAQGLHLSLAGGTGLIIETNGESGVNNQIRRFSADTASPAYNMSKARGTIASPAVPALNDVFGTINFQGLSSAPSTFTNSCRISAVNIDTSTYDGTHAGGQIRIAACPIGSGTLSTVASFDASSGFQMFSNPAIDQNRVFRPRAYTVGTVPTATATGFIYVTDEGGGGCNAYCDGTSWRRSSDLQVITASTPTSRGLLGRMTTRVAYVNQDIVQRTYTKLSAAGLLTKLLGLWVFAGAPASQADALRNWITLGTRDLTVVGSPTWSQLGGFTGDGSTSLLTTGATATTFGIGQNDATYGAYVLTGSASAAAIIGYNSGAVQRRLYMQSRTSGAVVTRLHDTTDDSFTPSYYTGLFTMTRSLSTGYNDSLDDIAATAIVRTSSAAIATPIVFLGTVDSTGSEFSTAQLAFSFVGTNLSTTDIANLRAIMVDYYLVQTGVLSGTYLVGRLPGSTASYEGQRLMVSDATVTASGNFGATLTGGSTNHVPVYYESGTPAWRIG